MVAQHSVDPLKFSNMLDSHLKDPPDEVRAALPLLEQYLQSSNVGLRRNTLFAIYVLALRPDSASELAPLPRCC